MCNQLYAHKLEMKRVQGILNHEPLDKVPSVREGFIQRLEDTIARYQRKFKSVYGHEDRLLNDYLTLNTL